jgi:hypothetical protein
VTFYLFSVIPFNTPNSPSYWQSDFSGQSTFDTISGWPEKKKINNADTITTVPFAKTSTLVFLSCILTEFVERSNDEKREGPE